MKTQSKRTSYRWLWLFFLLLLNFPAPTLAEDETYSFDVDEFTKKNWEWKGEAKFIVGERQFREESIFYPLKFDKDQSTNTQDATLRLSLESRWDWDWSQLYLSVEAWRFWSTQEDSNDDNVFVREAYWVLAKYQPDTFEIGKRLLRWGKGYAYNPVAFLERPKNPDDPDAAREGMWLMQGIAMTGEAIGLKDSSLTVVYAPVRSNINDDVLVEDTNLEYESERDDDDVIGLKAYGLIGTTDLDLYYVSHTQSGIVQWGFDFASNLSNNFEIHGEYALSNFKDAEAYQQSLLGLRYLSVNENTWIMEVYHDGSGLTREESEALYKGKMTKQTLLLLQKEKEINQNYGYLQISIKEPFELLYFTPSLSWIRNLDDGSDNLQGKLSYAPSGTWNAQATWQHFQGNQYTQYGESLIQDKIEVQLTLAF